MEESTKAAALVAVSKGGTTYLDLPEVLKADREIALAAVKENGANYVCIPENLIVDREIALAAVKKFENMYLFLPNDLKYDQEFALDAIYANLYVFDFLPDGLQKNPGMISAYLDAIVHDDEFRDFASQYITDHPDCDPDLLTVGLDDKLEPVVLYDGEEVDIREYVEDAEYNESAPDMEDAVEKKPHIAYVEWETDGIDPDELELPSEVELPDWVEDYDDAEDYLSNTYGWLVKSLDIDFGADPERDEPVQDEEDIGD